MTNSDQSAPPAWARVLAATFLCTTGLLAAGTSSGAGAFSAEDSPATLTVTYTLTGSGVERPASHERNVTWTVNDRYESKAALVARRPNQTPGLHGIAADGKAAMPGADPGTQSMVERGKKAIAKCGDDQACVQREFMSIAADGSADTSAPAAPRYQEFDGRTQTGTFHIDEKAHEAYYDAACSSRNEAPCAFDTVVTGEGPAVGPGPDGKTSWKTSFIGELDLVGGTFSLIIPPPGFGKVKSTVTTASKDVKAGTTDATRSLRAGLFGDQVRVACGECRTASGTATWEVEDELLKRKAKLVLEWKFTRN